MAQVRKGSTKSDDRVVCRTPTPGKKPTRIERWKFDEIRRAILAVIPREGEGVLFSQLFDLVESNLDSEVREGIGSISWYTTTVKLELEVAGEIRRQQTKGPQRLLRR